MKHFVRYCPGIKGSKGSKEWGPREAVFGRMIPLCSLAGGLQILTQNPFVRHDVVTVGLHLLEGHLGS